MTQISTMTSAFYSSEADAISRTLDVHPSLLTEDSDLRRVYEVSRCLEWILQNKFKRIALQFPDELLHLSGTLASLIEIGCGQKVFILGDTSYGSCCVDEVAAQHYSADCIIHYGRSCLSPTKRFPVLYVFGIQPLDCTDCVKKFSELIPADSHVIVMYDVVYTSHIDGLESRLHSVCPNIIVAKLTCYHQNNDQDAETGIKIERCGRVFFLKNESNLEDHKIFYIGAESLTLTNLMMTFNKCKFFTYNPASQTGRSETLDVNRALMKRYYMIEKAKDAQIVGIIAGTLGVADYLSAISRLKEVIKKAGKKSYTFVVGKLNVPKLANFMEVDVYVLVACPENSLIDSKEFYRPVVTPFEMELACNQAREWTGEYITDFRELLPGAAKYVEIQENPDETTDVSLITGKIRNLGPSSDGYHGDAAEGTVVQRNAVMAVSTIDNAGAGFLASRSWQGLEQQLGQTPVTKFVEGTKGIASRYQNEPSIETCATE